MILHLLLISILAPKYISKEQGKSTVLDHCYPEEMEIQIGKKIYMLNK